jgi:hypothetical protein
MIIKSISVALGAVLWGIGASVDVAVAIGKYGPIGFFAGALLAVGILGSKGFLEHKNSTDLWIFILRGLAVESLLFPIANLIMIYMLSNGFPYAETRAVLIESGLIAVILMGVFLFNGHLLNTKIRRRHTHPEENKLDKKSGIKEN